MTAKLHTAEVDPATHQGPAAFVRDLLTTAARMDYHRPAGVPAYTTHDLQDCGVEQAMDDLLKEEEVSGLRGDLNALGVFVEGMRERLVARWNHQDETNRIAAARLARLEELVQENETLRVRMADAERRLDDIVRHNDRISNTITPVVLGVDALTDLVRHAPTLLKLAEG